MTPLLWAGLAVAVPLAAWWLWQRHRARPTGERDVRRLKDRNDGEVFILTVLASISVLLASVIGEKYVHGWWSLPFWIVGILAAITTGLLLGLAVIVTAVELDLRDDERMNLTLRRVEGGDET